MSKPFPLAKLYHKAGKMRSDGAVSALCFARPRAIDLTRALWTIRPEAVTCPKCKKVMAKLAAAEPTDGGAP